MSVRARAVAAYVDEITRILNGGRGEPTRVVIEQRLGDGANATDDVDGEWEEAQWEGDGVEMTEGDGEEKAHDQEWHEPEEWELEMAREADTDQEWHEPAEWELEMAREADAFGDG